MAKNIKDFEYYSDDNPFMMYHGDQSYCNKCKRFFIKKHGAQSHSSKIHNMTLDGRILKQEIELTPKLVSKETPPVENISDDEDYHKTINEMDKRLSLNLKIRQLERMGLMQQAYEIREKNNMFETKPDETPKKSTNDETQNMLIVMLASEKDPARYDKITQLIMMRYCGMSDDMIMMELMSLAS